jgi:hypothetical protein
MAMERRPMRKEKDLYALLGGQEVDLPEFHVVAEDHRAQELIVAALTADPVARMEAVRAARARVAGGELAPEVTQAMASPVEEGAAGRARGGWRGALALVLFGVGVWLGWPGAPGQGTVAPGPAPTAPSAQEAASGLAADVAALEQGLDEVLEKVPEVADPLQWRRVVERLPSLSRLWARDVAAARDLPPGFRERLKLLDTRFASAGLPRPFLVEDSTVMAQGDEYWERFDRAAGLPEWARHPPPELRPLAAALHRIELLGQELEEDLALVSQEGLDRKGLVPVLIPFPALASGGPRSLLHMAFSSTERRRAAARWVRPGAEEIRRGFLGAARVLPLLSPREREAVVFLFRWVLGSDSYWFVGELAMWPPEALLPNIPDDGPGAALRAVAYNLQRPVLRRMGREWRDTAQAGVSWGLAAIETDPPPGGELLGWGWRRRVFTDVLQGLVELERGEEARAIFRRERDRLQVGGDLTSLMDVAESLSGVWRAAGAEGLAEARWLLARAKPNKNSRQERLDRDLGWAR